MLLCLLEWCSKCVVILAALVMLQRTVHSKLLRMKRLHDGAKAGGREEDRQRRHYLMDIVFLHPDLGLGGAERLVVDAAVGLQSHQNVYPKVNVLMVTNYHNRKRAFAETTDGTVAVVVRGSWFPRHIRNRALVLCATIRMTIAAVVTCVLCPRTDAFVVDQVSTVLPVVRLLCPSSSLLFYCHFPDQLCDPSRANAARRSLAHRLYRSVFDAAEAWTMNAADSIVCNSRFSRSVTVTTFPQLAARIDDTKDVFYPPINVSKVLQEPIAVPPPANGIENISEIELLKILRETICIVSLNRYERKKNIPLAIKSFAILVDRLRSSSADAATKPRLTLIIAGGYDPRLSENVEHYAELQQEATACGIADQTVFLRSISERCKYHLLSKCRCVVYTPSGEHFGIVPVEAMAFGRVVVAVNDGGPLESITPTDRFGFLRAPDPQAFADVMLNIVRSEELCRDVGESAKRRCVELFSLESFSQRLMERLKLLQDAKVR